MTNTIRNYKTKFESGLEEGQFLTLGRRMKNVIFKTSERDLGIDLTHKDCMDLIITLQHIIKEETK